MSFKYIKESSVSEDTTAEYQFTHLRGRPVLVCAPATRENRPLLMESLAEASRPDRKMSPAEQLEEIRIGRLRQADRWARLCVKGWRGVVDDEGKEPAFTVDACREFLEAIATEASWMFDDFLGWIVTPSNFVRRTQFDVEGTAKNSERG